MDYEIEKQRRLLNWYKGKKEGPFKIDIELHRRCNLRCLSCSRRADPKYDYVNEFSKTIEMPKEKWLSIVDEAAKLNVKEWHIAGGGDPPFLPEITFPVMERIKKYGMYGILTTNGVNLPENKIAQIVNMGWDRIHFSIDGPDAETHDYLRGRKGAFDKAINAIKILQKYKTQFKNYKPLLNINTVLSIKNYKKISKIVELAHSLEVKYIFIEPLIIYSEYGQKLKLKEKHLQKFQNYLIEAIKLTKKYCIDSNFSQLDKNLDKELIKKSSSMHEIIKKDAKKYNHPFLSVPCYDPWFHMTIKANGRVTSCDVATDEGDDILNKSLKDIWYGPYFEKQRVLLLNKNIPSFCAQCNPSHTTQRRRFRKEIENLKNKKMMNKIKKWMKKLKD